jgi:hypothetical protein
MKFAKELLKKFQMDDCHLVSLPMMTSCKLSKLDDSHDVDQSNYRSMIRILLYFTTSRLNLMQKVCMVSQFQSTPK